MGADDGGQVILERRRAAVTDFFRQQLDQIDLWGAGPIDAM
jgi:hypothetical protein